MSKGLAQVDVISRGKGGMVGDGAVAGRLLKANFNINALRTNDTLLYDEWKDIDKVVVKAAQERLVGVKQMMARGLTYNVPDGLGKTVLSWQDQSDISDATVSIDARVTSDRDRPEYGISYMPLPVIHKDFSFNIREIHAARNGSMPLDTTMAEMAARKVAEMAEQMFFQGYSSYNFGGGTIYGIEDYPYVNSGSLSAGWADSDATGQSIIGDVSAMKQALIDAKHYGPYGLWVPTAYETKLDEDYTTNYPVTIRERLAKISNLSFVEVADKMTSTKVSLVQLTADVLRVVVGLEIVTVEWDSEGGMQKNFKVMAIMLPQPRKTQEDDCGIAVYSE
jgi:uncharacterized linocin/CFP29 family protein